MSALASPASARYQALYLSTVQEAAAGGSLLMGKLVAAGRATLQAREAACRDLRERDALAQSGKQLREWEAELCRRFPKALLDAFSKPDAGKKPGTLSVSDVEFDALELMDEAQVLTSVTMARTQQVAMLAAEASLADLNTLICGTLGLGAVHAERNPLRPQVYINALQALVEQTRLPAAIQLDWLGAMGAVLGQELRKTYVDLCASLRGHGVVAAGYAVSHTHGTPGAPGMGRGVAQDWRPDVGADGAQASVADPTDAGDGDGTGTGTADFGAGATVTDTGPAPVAAPVAHPSGADSTLLTLDKLRRLLVGELDEPEKLSAKEQFAQAFAREFDDARGEPESEAADFDGTVPAALEALKEMEQVDEVVQRLQQRRDAAPLPPQHGDTTVEAVRAKLRARAQSLAQALSLEVVSLMVDNIATDARLLQPVQQLIRRLEPALLRLALVDPRLFTNKQHPARILVQEMADHSLAYASVESSGFADFVRGVEWAIAPLNHAAIEDAEPFERVLGRMQEGWRRAVQATQRSRAQAMQALQHAEERNVLAEKIGRDIVAHPDASRVPAVIIDFLCGPWAQVVAQAGLDGKTRAAADKYQALISAMLWSTHPDLSRKDTAKLTRLVPLLLATLREGLETIHYPATKTSVFLGALMGLHQHAFRAAQKPPAGAARPPAPAAASVSSPHLVEDGNPWVAPEEALASNLMDLPDVPDDRQPVLEATAAVQEAGDSMDEAGSAQPLDAQATLSDLPLGSWVELLVNGQWVRTQLTWATPHGTLFLFTSVLGATHSMTRRSRDKLVAAGQLRVLSGRPVVDGALNAVAQMAMRNSVNTLI